MYDLRRFRRNNFYYWISVGVLLMYCTYSVAVLHEYKLFQTTYSNGTLYDDVHITFREQGDETMDNKVKKKIVTDPCATFTPLKPRFSVNGARISDLKCAEYMLNLVNRQAKRDREEECKVKEGKHTKEKPYRVIISKYSTKPGEYPHMTAIGWKTKDKNKWLFLCGGSLISPNFVLTAAHCSWVMNSDLESMEPDIVRLGARDIENPKFESPVDTKIKRFISHPLWKSPTKYYDIALVELLENIQFSQLILPACLEGK